jgi:hypothetical protein
MRAFVPLLVVLLSASSASAEETVREHAIAVNPVFAPLGTLAGEYEGAVSPSLSLGISGWYEYRDVEARWLYAKGLYYPGGVALRGLGVGPLVGVTWAYPDDDSEAESAPIVGLLAQYDLVLYDRFLLGAGISGRMVAAEIPDGSALQRFDGEVRIVAGLLF